VTADRKTILNDNVNRIMSLNLVQFLSVTTIFIYDSNPLVPVPVCYSENLFELVFAIGPAVVYQLLFFFFFLILPHDF